MTTDERIKNVLFDPACSHWLRDCLNSALSRDPIDAANDALVLSELLNTRCDEILESDKKRLGLDK